MEKEYYIKVTTNLYRLTLLFPKKEPLRYKLREIADEILALLSKIKNSNPKISQSLILETKQSLEVLDSFLELAKNQNWVSPYDILALQGEYAKIKGELEGLSTKRKEEIKTPSEKEEEKVLVQGEKARERLQKILEILKEKGPLQVKDLKQIFPKVTKRTLRRNLEALLKQGLIERVGEKNDTFYCLKGRT